MYEVKKIRGFEIIKVYYDDLEIGLMNYGAGIYSLRTKDFKGVMEDIVLVYENIDDYYNNNIYLNASIGPISGRVKNGEIITKDKTYQLEKNNNGHALHSSNIGLSYKFFDYEVNEFDEYTEVVFLYEEKDIVSYLCKVIYQVSRDKIRINFEVETDQDFVFNLTNHAYLNLSGNLKEKIYNHEVFIRENLRHELSDELLISGKLLSEELYNFKKKKLVGSTVKELSSTPKGGIDDIYFIPDNDLRYILATVYEPNSGRLIKIRSTYDHLVFYSHNNINEHPLKYLGEHQKHYALCFECQKSPLGFADEKASSPYLKKDKLYQESIVFEFSNKH